MNIKKTSFGRLADGQEVHCFTFSNSAGTVIRLLDYGLTIQKLELPDKDGKLQDVVLGFDTIAGYEGDHPYFGCLVGPNANRIKNGRVKIDDEVVQLSQNEGANQLHSGKGFQEKIWRCTIQENKNGAALLHCSYIKKAGEEGFPGNLKTEVTFQLRDDDVFDMHYTAATDAPTIVNLTRHDYFNLKDGGASDVFDHHLQIKATQITENDAEGIPTGILKNIARTSYDFSSPTKIQTNLAKKQPDLMPVAYDNNYDLESENGKLKYVAQLSAPDKDRVITIYTTQPGLQFYTGYHTKNQHGKGGVVYQPYSGVCLETQHFPDAPNHQNFQSTILRPKEVYQHQLQYHFGLKE